MLEDIKKKMDKCIYLLKIDFSKVVVNKITPSVFDDLCVKCHGVNYKINQLSTILKDKYGSLFIKPFDKKNINLIYDSIINSNLKLSPTIVKDEIKVIFPKMTEDRRKMLVKTIKTIAETSRVSIRNIRRDFNKQIKLELKNSNISIDNEKKISKKIQELTDEYIKKVDNEMGTKETELMKV